ncbi:MAG: hypothetical protein KC519_02350 [Anaerolineae bacterium]|nr:hypothetical protein [Anaerolineae bacterium]
MITREISVRTFTQQLILDIWDGYAEKIGPQQAQIRPQGRLVFELLGQLQGGQLSEFPKPIRLLVRATQGGYYGFFGEVRLPNGNRRNASFLAPGTYRLRISEVDGLYQSVDQDVVLPTPKVPYKIALEPGSTYPYLPTSTGFRGLVKAAALPLAGAHVQVSGFPCSTLTDRAGGWQYYFAEPDSSGAGLPPFVEIVVTHPETAVILRRNEVITTRKIVPIADFTF